MTTSSENTVLTSRGDMALIAARVVEQGHEEAFQGWARDVLAAAATLPGHLGGGLFRPVDDGGPWIVVHRFRDRDALGRWLKSPVRQLLFAHQEHHHEVARRELAGLEAWFAEPGGTAPPPPRWKTAVSSAIGIFPISLLGSLYLTPSLTALPQVARTAVFALLFSVLMTYAAMPVVTRVLRRWLSPGTPSRPVHKESPP
ncbi:antibiotic biosynthesis monooxygenase [Streptomyces lavendulae]|uniref:antibiotic biosynthesis monooxygenase n=1 Tax=Streptomyces lavendulae TaxID=1914 RepID=UPI0033E07411